MTTTIAIILTILAIIFSGLFSGSEIAFVQSSKVRMEIDATRGGWINRIIRGFSHKEEMFISTLLVGNNVVLVVYGIAISFLINPWLDKWFDNNEALTLVCNTIFSTGIILIMGEFLPKTTFRINPNFMMRLLALPLFLIYIILYPVSLLISGLSSGLMKLFGIKENPAVSSLLTIEQLDDYIEESLEKHNSENEIENEVKIFRNAIDFKDTQIEECMIPRNEIVAVPEDSTTRSDLIKKFIATGLSKIVVYKEDIDDIIGYIHISELFDVNEDWKEHLKPVIFTPETMLANKMMRRMLSEKKSLAIVVDEFGGTSGLVTLEDLVEEIFGEIEDEHDKGNSWGHQLPDGSYEFSGRAEVSNINEQYHIGIKESEDYHTLAGFMLENLEAFPEVDKTYEIDNLKLTVLKMTASRINLIKLEVDESDN
ncbi:MAG: hemolysin family protein [Muribaculaceae bacterium]|nr:hemolysin family protein [Muribaculaceae bacterium]